MILPTSSRASAISLPLGYSSGHILRVLSPPSFRGGQFNFVYIYPRHYLSLRFGVLLLFDYFLFHLIFYIYPLTPLRKRISAAVIRLSSLLVVTQGSLPYRRVGLAASLDVFFKCLLMVPHTCWNGLNFLSRSIPPTNSVRIPDNWIGWLVRLLIRL